MIIVLAMHGAPPNDLPNGDLHQLVSLHMQLEREGISGPERREMENRYAELDARVRNWPRTSQNDPFYAASQVMRARLSEETGLEVLVGFNEFCAPSLEQTLNQAVSRGAGKVIVVTPMLTPGGDHAEKDIPAAVEKAKKRHKNVEFVYAWPFEIGRVAKFLAQQIKSYEGKLCPDHGKI